MAKIDFSVVVTVLNEEKTVGVLLDTLINQIALPNEIIVIDAGSDDKTPVIVKEKSQHTSVPIIFFHEPGVNRSQGRNIGILRAKNEHIAVIDAGCEADKSWLLELSDGFDGGTSVVAGYYLPIIQQPLQSLFAAYVATSPADFNESTFLPSSRSLAFTKAAWEHVGRYPEHLSTCEDLVFAKNLKNKEKMVVRKQALVYWQQAEGMRSFFRQIAGYAQGDIEAGYGPHVWRILSVWARYVILLSFPICIPLYMLFPMVKHKKKLDVFTNILALPIIQVVCDWGVMVGSLRGLLHRVGLR